jgi:hypothetical protein
MAKLRFLTNHALVLIHVANNPKSTLREIATAVTITERAVQTVLKDMQVENLIKKEKQGRKNHYWVNYAGLLSYPLEGPYRTVVELAQALTELGRQLRDGEIPMDFPPDQP